MKEKRVHAKWQQNWAHDGWSEKSYYLSLELLCQGQALALIESQLYLQLVVGHNLAARPGLSGAKVWVVGWQASRHLPPQWRTVENTTKNTRENSTGNSTG